MAIARRSSRSRPVVLILGLLALTLVVIDRAGPDAPTQGLRSAARDAFASLGGTVAWLWPFDDSAQVNRLQAENARLNTDLQQARAELLQAGDAQRQRDNLLSLLALPTYSNADKVVAPVIAMETTNFDNTVELGKGRRDGIETGMPVVNAQGLVGRVIEVSDSRSSVVVITDTTSNVGVRVARTGEVGVAIGTGQDNPLRMDLIEGDSTVTAGDVVVTNGMQGSVFPPGLVVGTVKESRASSNGLRRNVTVAPAVDLHRLEDVLVVKWRG